MRLLSPSSCPAFSSCPVFFCARPLARGLLLSVLAILFWAGAAFAGPTPYASSPVAIAATGMTRVEAENYDLGGEGVAYHDISSGGLTAYRTDNIGVYADGGASNGCAVGYAQAGEWDGYTLNVAAAGPYTLMARLACPPGGSTFHLEFGPVGQVGGAGVLQSSEFIVPSGNWSGYQDVSVPAINLPAGPLWMRLVLDSGGPYVANFDFFSLAAGRVTPHGGSPVVVTGSGVTKVEAENYDLGGESVAYHDVDNGGQSGYRSDNIGVYSYGSASNSYAVGWAQAGEWSGYTLNVAATGFYTLTAHVGAYAGGGTFHLEFGPVGQIGGGGVVQSSEFTAPNSGNWSTYQDVSVPAVRLPAGPLWMRLVLDSGSSGSYVADFDFFSLARTPFPAPTGLVAEAYGTSTVYLSWNAVSGASAYNIYRSTVPGGEGNLPYQTNVSNPSYSDSAVTAGTTYYYRVTAVGNSSEGGLSNEVSATSGANQLPAPVLKARAGATSVNLTWSAVVGATSYNLYRSIGANGQPAGMPGYPSPSPPPMLTGLSGTTFSDTGLTAGTAYSYQVAAVSKDGQGYPSNVVTATPGASPPPAPTNLIATAGSSQVALSWTAASGATYYNVYRSTTPGGEGAAPYACTGSGNYPGAPSTTTTYTDTAVANGTTYYYRIAAGSNVGEGGLSNEASATPGSTPLPAPTGLTATAAPNGGQSIALSWNAVSGAASYNVYRNTASYGYYATIYKTGVTGTSYVDTGVNFGTAYTYYVCAVNTSGQGSQSSWASATLFGFGLSASPTPITITRGAVGAVAITVTPGGGYTGPVVLSGKGLPSGTNAWFYPGSVLLPTLNNPPYQAGLPSQSTWGAVSSNLFLAVPASAAPGTYILTITATSSSGDGFTSTTPVTLTIN